MDRLSNIAKIKAFEISEELKNVKPGTLLKIPSSDTDTSNDWLVAINRAEAEAKAKAEAEAKKKKAEAEAKAKAEADKLKAEAQKKKAEAEAKAKEEAQKQSDKLKEEAKNKLKGVFNK